jgi:subtilisin family serine protease
MPAGHQFQHLPLLMRYQGAALIRGGGKQAPETKANRANYAAHAGTLSGAARSASDSWQARQVQRALDHLPVVPAGIPVLLQVDTGLDLDILREKFGFEIVSEQEDGYVIVASEDLHVTELLTMINDFATDKYGSATIASIHKLFDDPTQEERLKRLLSESLYRAWPTIQDDQNYIVDVGVGGLGAMDIPDVPTRGKRDSDADWALKESGWAKARADAYQAWDDVKVQREGELSQFVKLYGGRIINIIDDQTADAVELPDSFTVRLELVGKGLRDLVLNYMYIFEVVEPDDIALPQRARVPEKSTAPDVVLVSPPPEAPTVCVIDSGIQEEHLLLEPAIDRASSHCLLPGHPADDVGDFVQPGGHGTRVAGAVLYGESVPKSDQHALPFWVQNARVLDNAGRMPVELFPPAAIRAVVERFHLGPRRTRLFNQSINVGSPCRTRHMSAWAAEIDTLSEKYDILIVQSAGNLHSSSPAPFCGVREHLAAGRDYPAYLNEDSCRVANPAQSLHALTVGSVAYGAFEGAGWRSVATDSSHPSAFSRSGFGIWGVIKPEVVELGGDNLRTLNTPPDVGTPDHAKPCYPELVRSTMYPPGPAVDRDDVGTSFAAPKVTHIAAHLQQVLPNEPCLLYRALIVQSARWPAWAWQANETEQVDVIRRIGYGLPDLERATTNGDYRTTLIAGRDPRSPDEDLKIKAGEAHIFQVPIPASMRGQADEFDILIEVTLAYTAQPRRTRRNLRRYLSTWVDWKSSKLGEAIESFRLRALKDQEDEGQAKGNPIPWMLHENPKWGTIRGVKRNSGTVQKDWAVVKSNTLPDSFCIAVVGHEGWSKDPASSARYSIAVSFEVIGKEIPIYEDLRVAIEELQAEIEAEVQAEAVVEIGV